MSSAPCQFSISNLLLPLCCTCILFLVLYSFLIVIFGMVSFIFAAALGELILDDGDVDIDVEETSKKLNSILFYC